MPESNLTIICPHCHETIALDDVFTHQIEEKITAEKDKEFREEKVKLFKRSQEWAKEEAKRQAETIRIQNNAELKLLKEQLTEQTRKTDEAQKQELELRRVKIKLEEEKKSFELDKQRQIDAEREKIRQSTLQQIQEEYRLKDAEKDKKLADAYKANEEMRRKLEQGSQQTQGEVLELELENILRTEFPYDNIEAIAKGITGADVLQRVYDGTGRVCGTIAWESKRTKAWSDSWIPKLKEDQRQAKAEIAVLISQVLPKNIKIFGFKEGIYISDYSSFLALATLLRSTLIQLATSKLVQIGKKEKMEVLWNYLTGVEFKQRIETIIESFTEMRSDLDKEKRAYTKIWAKREKEIQRVIDNTIGMHGDLQGLIGASLPEINQLALDDGKEQENLPETEEII